MRIWMLSTDPLNCGDRSGFKFSSVAFKMPSFCLIFFLAVFRTVETFTRTSVFKDQVFPHFLLSTGTIPIYCRYLHLYDFKSR
jgi:hypothetical protein